LFEESSRYSASVSVDGVSEEFSPESGSPPSGEDCFLVSRLSRFSSRFFWRMSSLDLLALLKARLLFGTSLSSP